MRIEYSQAIKTYYQHFLVTLPQESTYRNRPWSPEKWGDSDEMTDQLGYLIATGQKTASTTTYWAWAATGYKFPALGLLTMVLNAKDEPLCIIESHDISLRTFKEIDAAWARAEAEGDRSLLHWRKSRWEFFAESLKSYGHTVSIDTVLVCERYRVIYREE